ncbi:MAG: hypothetical protein V9G23_06980 [Giesbergeria sp.]
MGRILRVHSRLQGPTLEKTLPELLRCGYVFLADAANQSGLVHAGEKINAIQSELSHVCPFTMVVKVAGTNEIQVYAQRAVAIAVCALHAASVARANTRQRTLPLTVCHLRASRLPGNRPEF